MEDQVKTPEEIINDFDPFGDGENLAQGIEDFPPEIQQDVEGLMYLGYLEDSFDFCGHSFHIRTLRGDEELLSTLVCKEFVETIGQARAWVWATVAMCLVAVDGDPNFCPPTSPNKREYAMARFRYCTSKWYWPLATYINSKYTALIDRQTEAIKRVEDLFKGSPLEFSPFAGSSTKSGDSEEQTEPSTQPQEDIRDYLDPQDSTGSNSD